jgi:glutaredoxin-related protein
MNDVQKRIDDLVKGNRVVLFMKGLRNSRCAAFPDAPCRS